MTTQQQAEALERKRNELGFYEVGRANGTSIYMLNEKANASQTKHLMLKPKLIPLTYQFLLPALAQDGSLKAKLNESLDPISE